MRDGVGVVQLTKGIHVHCVPRPRKETRTILHPCDVARPVFRSIDRPASATAEPLGLFPHQRVRARARGVEPDLRVSRPGP
jgi:hypothetical protein